MNKKDILETLNRNFPNPRCELEYTNDYELLLSIMLSAQTTDKRVNMVTKTLFYKYKSLKELNTMSIKDIENEIKSIGLYKTKAKNFKNIVEELNETKYVPNDRNYLSTLPGIGRKTINVFLGEYYKEPNFGVDTHVSRLAKRFEIVNEEDNILEIENKLMKYFKKNKEDWVRINQQIVLFGRYICTAKKPLCQNCMLNKQCKKKP